MFSPSQFNQWFKSYNYLHVFVHKWPWLTFQPFLLPTNQFPDQYLNNQVSSSCVHIRVSHLSKGSSKLSVTTIVIKTHFIDFQRHPIAFQKIFQKIPLKNWNCNYNKCWVINKWLAAFLLYQYYFSHPYVQHQHISYPHTRFIHKWNSWHIMTSAASDIDHPV